MITVEIESDTITPALEELTRLLDDLTPVMQEIGDYLVGATKDRFQEGKAPDGSVWAPKSPATLARYLAEGARSAMVRPLVGPSKTLSTNIFKQAGPSSVEVGSPTIYGAVMQFGAAKGDYGETSRGSPIPWGDIPARPFLGISPDDETNILSIIDREIKRAFGELS